MDSFDPSNFSAEVPRDLRAASSTTGLTKHEKAVVQDVAVGAAVAAYTDTENPMAAQEAYLAGQGFARKNLADLRTKLRTEAPLFNDEYQQARKAAYEERMEQNAAINASTFYDRVEAARQLFTADAAILRMIETAQRDFQPDPDYDYRADRVEFEKGLSIADREFLRESTSLEEAEYRRGLVQERLDNERVLGAYGTGPALAASLIGGMMDSAGFLAGVGVGKAAHLAGIGARTAWIAGQRGRAVGYAAAEGAVGNVLIDATVEASGLQVTWADYLTSAGFGAAFGQLGLLGRDVNVLPGQDPATRAGVLRQDRADTTLYADEIEVLRSTTAEDGTPVFNRRVRVNRGSDRAPDKWGSEVLLDLTLDSDPMVATLAKRLYQTMGDDVPIVVRKKGARTNAGLFDPTRQQVTLNPDAPSWVTLHELAHANTADRVAFGRANPESVIGKRVQELEEVFEQAKAAAKAEGRDQEFYVKYSMTNLDEFIAGMYSNHNSVHEWLRGIRMDEQTLLNKFVNAVRRVLGIPKGEENALTRGIGIADELMQDPLRLNYTVVRTTGEGQVTRDLTPQYRELPSADDVLKKTNERLNRELDHHRERMDTEGGKENFKLYEEAQKRVGPDATPDQIADEVVRVQREKVDAYTRIALSDVPEDLRLFRKWTSDMVDEEGNLQPIYEGMAPSSDRAEAGKRWGVTERTVEDKVELALLQDLIITVEKRMAEHPVDKQRLNSLFAKVPWLASTGLRLMRSKNPMAQVFAQLTLEVTTGAGRQGRSAAITKDMRQRVYMSHLTAYQDAYAKYRKDNGGSRIKDAADQSLMARFDREVALHRENRRLGVPDDVPGSVREAADALDEGYTVMGKDQKYVGTVGAERLWENGTGYGPRRFRLSRILEATNEEVNALVDVLERQLKGHWSNFENGDEFARDTAVRYIERARTNAYGGTEMPANMTSPETATILRDILRKEGLPEDQVDKLIGQFGRGGASHTKQRLELDLTETFSADGREHQLIDFFDLDQRRVYQQYARRVSGDVALMMHGIPGEKGLELIEKLMKYGPGDTKASPDDIDAFRQTVAEFHGRPYGDNHGKWMDNLRALVSTSRLGGMAFTQFAESFNGVGALGLKAVIDSITSMPRLMREVYSDTVNPVLRDIELVGGDIGRGHRIVFPYQQADDIAVFGRDDLTTVDRFIRGASNAVPHLSGWHAVQGAQIRGMTEQIVHKSVRFIRDGGEDVALDGMGIDAALRDRLRAELDNIAEFDSKGNLVALNLVNAKDTEAVAQYVTAVRRGGAQIIQGNFVGESGKWAHDGFLRILTQFRTFSLTSMEKQWTRQRVDHGSAKAFGLLMGSMSFALPLHIARTQLNSIGREDRDEYLDRMLSPSALLRATLNYSSLSGSLGDILDSGAMLMGMEGTGVRTGAGSGIMDSVPGVGYVNQTVRGITSFAPFGSREADPTQLVRALPGGNIPYLVPIINAAFD